jgi:hypothetical protein
VRMARRLPKLVAVFLAVIATAAASTSAVAQNDGQPGGENRRGTGNQYSDDTGSPTGNAQRGNDQHGDGQPGDGQHGDGQHGDGQHGDGQHGQFGQDGNSQSSNGNNEGYLVRRP